MCGLKYFFGQIFFLGQLTCMIKKNVGQEFFEVKIFCGRYVANVYPICIQCILYIQCVSNVYSMCIQCESNVQHVCKVFPMCIQCVFNVYPMCIQCVSNVYPMCIQCVFNMYPIWIQYELNLNWIWYRCNFVLPPSLRSIHSSVANVITYLPKLTCKHLSYTGIGW